MVLHNPLGDLDGHLAQEYGRHQGITQGTIEISDDQYIWGVLPQIISHGLNINPGCALWLIYYIYICKLSNQ